MSPIWREWDEFLDIAAKQGWDVGVKLEGGLDGAWSCELRVTREPNLAEGPDRSHVTYAVGGAIPDDVLEPALKEMKRWLAERDKAREDVHILKQVIRSDAAIHGEERDAAEARVAVLEEALRRIADGTAESDAVVE